MPQHWITERLNELDKKAIGLAKHLGLPQPRISDITNGTRLIKVSEIPALAEYLEMSQEEALRHLNGDFAGLPSRTVMVRGAVQAGIFSESSEWPEVKWYPSPLKGRSKTAPEAEFALEVRGTSMNRVYPPGSIVHCLPIKMLTRDFKEGDRVIVIRQKHDLPECEATIKEIRSDESGRFWLWPLSSDPQFQTPWQIHGDDGDIITVQAVVVGAYTPGVELPDSSGGV